MTPTAEDWSHEVGPGWRPIVRAAVQHLLDLGVPIVQVKEKFGGLRIYVDGDSREADRIIEIAVVDCSRTCEDCGSPDDVSLDGMAWVKTLCAPCHATRRTEQYKNWSGVTERAP